MFKQVQPMPATSDPDALLAVGRLALQRHAELRARQPHRAATAYLRAALTGVRALARHARRQPDLLPHADALLTDVIAAAQTAEADLAAAGRPSAPYLTLLVAAASLRLAWHLAGTPPEAATPPVPGPSPVVPSPARAAPRAAAAPQPARPPAPRRPNYPRQHDRFVHLQSATIATAGG